MRHRFTGFLVGAMGFASAALFALSGASCSQPTIQCVVAHGQFVSYYAKYEVVSGDASCYENIQTALELPTGGENIAMATYLQPVSSEKYAFADFDNRKIAVQGSVMGLIYAIRHDAGTDEADAPYGIGVYSTAPDTNNICYAGGAGGTAAMAASDLDIEEFDTGELDDMGNPVILPAEHYRQEWKNIRLFVTAGVPGTQAVGEMHFEDITAGCSVDYKFVALFPSVDCTGEDAMGNPVPDEGFCDPNPDPSVGRIFGSGINPDFKVSCDPTLLHCVLAEPPLTGEP
jgi:hypothetical protein